MKRLSRLGAFILLLIMVVIIMVIGILLIPNNKDETIVTLEKENVILKSEYIDAISIEDSNEIVKKYSMVINENEDILGYKITNEQVFYNYLKYHKVKEEKLTKGSKNSVTHYIYTSILTGDIIKEEKNKNITYKIINARITYQYIPVCIDSNKHTITYSNKDKTKEKTLSYQEYIAKLDSINEREDVLEW